MKKGCFVLLVLSPLALAGTAAAAKPPVLTGTVTDPDGHPLAGVHLVVLTRVPSPTSNLLPAAPPTGPDGAFAIPDLPEGRVLLQGFLPGYQSEFVAVCRRDEPFHLTLRPLDGKPRGPDGQPVAGPGLFTDAEPGCDQDGNPCPADPETRVDGCRRAISGWVVDTDGTPLEGASVDAEGMDVSHTFGDGSFGLDTFLPGPIQLTVARAGYTTVQGTIQPFSGKLRLVAVLAEEPDATLRGQVFGPDGAPLAGATVHACTVEAVLYGSTDDEGPPCENEEPATTDAEGRFVLGPVWPDWYEVRARHPGLVDGVASRVRAAPGDGNEPLKLRLRRGTVVTGRAVDEAGKPVSGADIEGWTGAGLARTVTGGDGVFRLEGMGAGRGGIRAEAAGYWGGAMFLQVDDKEKPQELEDPVSLRKKEPGEIAQDDDEGPVVVPAEVDPPGDVTVTGVFRDLEPGQIPLIVVTRGSWPWRAEVDLDGHWSVEGLSPGTWTIRAHLGRGLSAPSFSKTIEIPPGITELHLELTFADGETAEEAP